MGEESLLKLQEAARQGYLFLSVGLLFCYNMALGASYVCGGLTLPLHLAPDTQGFLALSEEEGTWYMSIVPVLNMLGTLAGYPIGEWQGRKRVLQISSILNILGFAVMYLSRAFWQLSLGRAVSTFGLGLGVMMPFVLISEITTIRARAQLSVVNILSLSGGILVVYVFAFLMPASLLIVLCCGQSALFLLLSPLLPESPHFLARRGRTEEARMVVVKLRGAAYTGAEQEVQEVLRLQEERVAGGGGGLSRWRKRTFLHPFAILVVLMSLIALNGVDCPLNFYGPTMFAEFG
jgi:MFS family permease